MIEMNYGRLSIKDVEHYYNFNENWGLWKMEKVLKSELSRGDMILCENNILNILLKKGELSSQLLCINNHFNNKRLFLTKSSNNSCWDKSKVIVCKYKKEKN